jgi:hypothetical protein
MNYAVMNEFCVDKNSGQYKAPFNTISQRSPRVHLQGHRRRHAQQRHALFDALARPARRADGDLGAGGGQERYYSVQLIDGNTYNYGYIGSRATGNEAGDYLVVGPDWQGEKPAGSSRSSARRRPSP